MVEQHTRNGRGGMSVKRFRPHLLVACVLALALLTGLRGIVQDALTDLRFRSFPREASGDIVLIAIDSPSIRDIGVWPWPRQLHADLIDKLSQAGVSEITFDIDFSSPSNEASDQSFLAALKRAGGAIPDPGRAPPDRLQHPGRLHTDNLLCGCAAWRCGRDRESQGQEGD